MAMVRACKWADEVVFDTPARAATWISVIRGSAMGGILTRRPDTTDLYQRRH